nr:hypothetical protein [Kofleriaceae bacterium]
MAPTLVEQLAKDPVRPHVIEECCELIDAQVKQKGFVMKTAYSTIKALKKRFIPEVVDAMLDDWLGKIQPHYEKWQQQPGTKFSDYIIARSDEVAEALLSVTDERAEHTSHGTAKKMYHRMRESAKKNVVEAIPDLSRLIEKRLAK